MFFILQVWRLQVHKQFHQDNIKASAELCFIWRLRGKPVHCPLSASGGYLCFLAYDPFFHFQGEQCSISKDFCSIQGQNKHPRAQEAKALRFADVVRIGTRLQTVPGPMCQNSDPKANFSLGVQNKLLMIKNRTHLLLYFYCSIVLE